MIPSRRTTTLGEAQRALADHRATYIDQSSRVAFGLLPERQADILELAREIRNHYQQDASNDEHA